MDQRNMPFGRQWIDEMEIDGPSYIPQEPRVLFGPATNLHHPNAPFGNASSSVELHLADHYDSSVPCEITHYNTYHPQPPNDLGVGSVPRMPPVPVNYGPSYQISSYGNYLVHGGSYQEYGRNHFADGVGCSYKRKTIESLTENNQLYSNASTSSSSSFMGPIDTRHPIELGLSSASYALPRFGEGNGSIALDENSNTSVRNRSGVSGVNSISAHHTPNYSNHSNQGSYSSGQSYQLGGPFWVDQPSSSNTTDGGAIGWSPPPPAMPFMHANTVAAVPMEIGNQGVQGPLEANGSRSSTSFLHFPYFNPQHYNLPYPSHPVHGLRGGNGNLPFHPQAPVPFHRGRSVSHPGPFEPTGFRIPWAYNAGIVPENTNVRHYNGPHLRVAAVDEVAIIDYGEAYGVGNYDHHRDMRLDIEDMSYEELLALGELIGSVNTGLPEETIASQLKTRTWASLLSINLEELPFEDQESSSCIICQDAYEDRDKIGILDCGHEYHADCLKKWLVVKNVCPICKSEALPGDRRTS